MTILYGKKIVLFLLIVGLMAVLLQAQETEESLLKAWEEVQKNDSKISIFEKLAEKRYKFKSEHFPFDGELLVLNLTVDDRWNYSEYSSTMGVVEVELVDLPGDFMKKHAYSYSIWAQNNMLYFNKKTQKWMSSKAYLKQTQKQIGRGPLSLFTDLYTFGPFILLVVVLAYILISNSRIQHRNKKYADYIQVSTDKSLEAIQKSLVLGQKSTVILEQILEELKKRK